MTHADGRLRQLCRKTELCRFYLRGACARGETCNFAHERGEVRQKPNLHATKPCPSMHRTGKCDDVNCPFAHSRVELRKYHPPLPVRGDGTQPPTRTGSKSSCISKATTSSRSTTASSLEVRRSSNESPDSMEEPVRPEGHKGNRAAKQRNKAAYDKGIFNSSTSTRCSENDVDPDLSLDGRSSDTSDSSKPQISSVDAGLDIDTGFGRGISDMDAGFGRGFSGISDMDTGFGRGVSDMDTGFSRGFSGISDMDAGFGRGSSGISEIDNGFGRRISEMRPGFSRQTTLCSETEEVLRLPRKPRTKQAHSTTNYASAPARCGAPDVSAAGVQQPPPRAARAVDSGPVLSPPPSLGRPPKKVTMSIDVMLVPSSTGDSPSGFPAPMSGEQSPRLSLSSDMDAEMEALQPPRRGYRSEAAPQLAAKGDLNDGTQSMFVVKNTFLMLAEDEESRHATRRASSVPAGF